MSWGFSECYDHERVVGMIAAVDSSRSNEAANNSVTTSAHVNTGNDVTAQFALKPAGLQVYCVPIPASNHGACLLKMALLALFCEWGPKWATSAKVHTELTAIRLFGFRNKLR
jgi:hypothetical protein